MIKTIYDEWKPADGLFWGKPENKKITFIPSSEDPGFVRVVGGEEGYIRVNEPPRTFDIPSGASFEVLGCLIKFTRA
jgi:hypothetical protein